MGYGNGMSFNFESGDGLSELMNWNQIRDMDA